MPLEFSAGVVVYNNEKYLLLHYPEGKGFHEHWGFPKGKIEKKESLKETAIRELKEETGIKELFVVPGFKKEVVYFYRKEGKVVRKEVIFFLVETTTEEIKLSAEHDDYRWADFGEAMNLIKFDKEKEVLREANKFIENAIRT